MEGSQDPASRFVVIKYDHVIFGAGLSGLLKAESLMRSMLPNERLLLIDPNPKNVCERTFCVWRDKTDNRHPHANLVSHRYSHFRITANGQKSGEIKSFDNFIYERIPGELFYKHMHQKILADKRFETLEESVVQANETKSHVEIKTSSGQIIYASQVWNSLIEGKPDMIQHFFGFEIEVESDFFTENLVDLMDFRVEQENEVRFVYVLPFSKRTGLVEFTVFSKNILSAEDYEKHLRSYLQRIYNLLNFKILNTEMGAIPMSLDPWPKFSSPMGLERILPIGGAAGQIKASTGYSFMRNQTEHRNIHTAGNDIDKRSLFQWRFRIYDTLLIGIMKSNGAVISDVFPKLFSQNTSAVLFRFLDEKTYFFEEIKIFFKLPWKHFLKQLGLNYSFIFMALFLILLNFFLDLSEVVQFTDQSNFLRWWLFPVIGLFTLGISHGAIDHLLDPTVSKLRFYLLYFIGLISFFALWLISPVLSLIVFILISADHFGESQFLRALKLSKNQFSIRILATIWGASVSLMAPLFHWDSAKSILTTLLRDSNIGEFISTSQASFAGVSLAVIAIASSYVISKYEMRALGRSLPGVLPTAFLCFTFWAMPLVPGFLTFFCFWHAQDTIFQQRKVLNWSAKKYFLKAAPFSAVASFSLIGLLYYFNSLANIWSYLFLFLGALTLSHSLVMKRFYNI
jgi:lycopene beta-cyclase